MRNMSFSMTIEPFKNRTKTVTRRFGWRFLNSNDVVMGVEKAMGLKNGEKLIRLGPIRIISVQPEPLLNITKIDVIKEGFPDWSPAQFIDMLVKHYKIQPNEIVNRIEFEYLD